MNKVRLMTYAHLGIESTKSHTQVLSTGQKLLNTNLSLHCKNFSGFQLNSVHCLFFGNLGLKKNKKDSTETILMKNPKKV